MSSSLLTVWFAFVAFVASLFRRPSSAAALPTPATARSPAPRVLHPSPPSSAVPSPVSSSQSANPERIFHSPSSPFPSISLSGLFATPPSLASDIELGPPSPPESQPPSHGPSIHTRSSLSTPRTPSSAVMVRLDRSLSSPTTMSDGSLEVVSLGDRRGFPTSPGKTTDIARLPSPWSPIGKSTSQDVWMSVDGMLVNATGPMNAYPVSPTGFRMSTPSLYSSSSALDAFGISVFVNLGHTLSNEALTPDTREDPFKSNQVRDENNSTPVTQGSRTPRKRRETIPSVKKSGASGNTTRATKCLSTPLTKIENVDVSHLRSTKSFSSMAYEFRMGLIADGRSMAAIEHIISLLDQDSPEHIQPLNNFIQPVEVV
ncbi:hypothetical protein JVU11DRAFT_3025 [Chiua virens]|nr:hypothetical protein JVU11DRAFT_3025 [Chiua virens]